MAWAIHTDTREPLGSGEVLDAGDAFAGGQSHGALPGQPGAQAAEDVRAAVPVLHVAEHLLRARRGGDPRVGDVQRAVRGVHLGSAGGRAAGLARADG